VPARQQITVQFVPQRVGEFTFYCNIGDHAERGMSGTLEVVSGR
jgi:FtsP/CotA-like multicopper oxidase with cupredoxin domain